jgi:hypothetical protein
VRDSGRIVTSIVNSPCHMTAGISALRELQVLGAARNSLPTVAACFSPVQPLARLGLACNCLPSLAGLSACPRLLELDASRNILVDVGGIAGCSLLRVR